ncbi:NlpC/P60 family protein [Fretibacter rubidus]|uniref:NlpC/P60 family protein n=1 Tax=Fretibacter rubidus TaxID=570162 RepID=UPI00352AF8C0
MTQTELRSEILRCAQDWIDTPYQHQASTKQAGCDCLGLVRGIWREIYGEEPIATPPYTANWAEETGRETLLRAAQSCLNPLDLDATQPGDIMLFRMTPNAMCKHIAVRASETTIIHAYWGRAVVESFLVPYWQKRHAYSFAFPPFSKVIL